MWRKCNGPSCSDTEYAKLFNVVDSFAKIPEHFANVDKAAKEYGHVGIISVGFGIQDISHK